MRVYGLDEQTTIAIHGSPDPHNPCAFRTVIVRSRGDGWALPVELVGSSWFHPTFASALARAAKAALRLGRGCL